MKEVLFTLAIAAVLASCSGNNTTQEEKKPVEVAATPKEDVVAEIQPQHEPDTLKGSLKAQASGKIGAAEIKVTYHSPAVRGRIVWGGLVPYENVWVTGAHMATSLETTSELQVGDTTLPAGKYALFTIPGKEKWTVIINKKWNQHLADEYDSKDDVLRMEVVPQQTENSQERLMYKIDPVSENEGQLNMQWEKVLISIPLAAE